MRSKIVATIVAVLLMCSICPSYAREIDTLELESIQVSEEVMMEAGTLSASSTLYIMDLSQCPYCGLDAWCYDNGTMWCPYCGFYSKIWDCCSRIPLKEKYNSPYSTYAGFLGNISEFIKPEDDSLGTLSCWYSDGDTIGRWNASSLDVYVQSLKTDGENPNFYFAQGIENGCSQWEEALGIPISVSTNSSSPIRFYGGTVEEINGSGKATYVENTNGCTWVKYRTEGTWKYGSTSIEGRTIIDAYGYILDNNRTSDQYIKTCTHELGHALGWLGHSSDPSDIMYSTGSSVTTLTSRDKNHLSQVYRTNSAATSTSYGISSIGVEADDTIITELLVDEEFLTFEDLIQNSDVAIVGRYIETIEHDGYIEHKFSVVDRIYGDVPDDEIYLYSNVGTAYVSGTDYSYELGADCYTEGVDYILVMEKLQSIMYDHDRYMLDTDILLNESIEEYSMYSEPIEIPADTSMIDYISAVYASVPQTAVVSPVVCYENETAELLGESKFVGVVNVLDLESEGVVHNGNVYRCSVDSLIAGENLNTYDDGTFLLVILKDTVEVGDSYVIGFTSSSDTSFLYTQTTTTSVYEVSDALLSEIYQVQASSQPIAEAE